MFWDWQSWWAQSLEWRPSQDHDARERADSFYAAFFDRHLTVDFAHPDGGSAWYVSTRLSGADLDAVLDRACEDARIASRTSLPYDVEVVRRTGDTGSYLFVINHSDTDAGVALEAPGTELLTGEPAADKLAVPAGAVRVVRLDG
ncbi:Beta-galactosidase C-terminal domain [Streptomyces sp. NPDC057509]|uniref:Beta-galactosidase C-terminal domain n=1 Tax=Streptomyces sp. NPDC057509 TaxID=3346152 RepID=UPI0036A05914